MMFIDYFWFVAFVSAVDNITYRIAQRSCKRYSISNRPSQDCSSQDLSVLPALFHDVVSLNLANNSFPIIDRFPRNYSNLHTLRLDNCAIRRITVQALQSLTRVRVLDLSHNRLQSITFGRGHYALTTLSLAHNSLRYLPDLSALRFLRVLDLSHNQILTVIPGYLPPNVESLRLTANRITHLTHWPILTNLQELDVSFNPLECDCPLWEFVGWAESLALFQQDTLHCQRPKSLRRSAARSDQMICGPEILSAHIVEKTMITFGESHRMCCLISAYPRPNLWWQHKQRNTSKIVSQRKLRDTGRVEFCLEISTVNVMDLGVYRCYAQLEDVITFKEFQVTRAHKPLLLKSSSNLLFYCQFSIGLFIFAFCCATCCILHRGRPSKTRPEKDNQCRTVLFNDNSSNITTTTSEVDHERYHLTDTYCLAECPCDQIEYSTCTTPEHPFVMEERKYIPSLRHLDDISQRRVALWRHRIAAMPAPLAQFDKETNIMAIVHTSV